MWRIINGHSVRVMRVIIIMRMMMVLLLLLLVWMMMTMQLERRWSRS
jgi:hypothetical protein